MDVLTRFLPSAGTPLDMEPLGKQKKKIRLELQQISKEKLLALAQLVKDQPYEKLEKRTSTHWHEWQLEHMELALPSMRELIVEAGTIFK